MRKMVIVLTVVMLIAGLVLASSYTLFQPQIARNQAKALENSLAALFHGSGNLTFTKVPAREFDVYSAKSADGKAVGYAIRVTGSGYGGPIQMLVGISPDLKKILGLQIVADVETPGMGARIAEGWFRKQFEGLNPAKNITYVKNATPDVRKNQIQAISGSTISTRAVTTALSETLEKALPAILKATNAAAGTTAGTAK